MDQIGAIIGPLIVSLILYLKGGYQTSFAILLIPALCALSVFDICPILVSPSPRFKDRRPKDRPRTVLKKYWLYIAAICCVAAGYVDFPLIAYHFKKAMVVSDALAPILFAVSMAAQGYRRSHVGLFMTGSASQH